MIPSSVVSLISPVLWRNLFVHAICSALISPEGGEEDERGDEVGEARCEIRDDAAAEGVAC